MRRTLAALVLRAAASIAAAAVAAPLHASYTDLWYNPAESGWGINFIEQDKVLFATLFVYGSDGRPAWYVGPAASWNGTSYTGTLYAMQGPWFGGAFNPPNAVPREAGAISFTPSSNTRGTLAYTVDGIAVTKAIQRQTWRRIGTDGTYHLAVDMRNNDACGSTGVDLRPFYAAATFTASADSSGLAGTLRMTVTEPDGGGMTFNGTYEQKGSIVEAEGTVVMENTPLAASLKELSVESGTIRGEFRLVHPGGCVQKYRIAGVRDD